jgi:hypothetical protein
MVDGKGSIKKPKRGESPKVKTTTTTSAILQSKIGNTPTQYNPQNMMGLGSSGLYQ